MALRSRPFLIMNTKSRIESPLAMGMFTHEVEFGLAGNTV